MERIIQILVHLKKQSESSDFILHWTTEYSHAVFAT